MRIWLAVLRTETAMPAALAGMWSRLGAARIRQAGQMHVLDIAVMAGRDRAQMRPLIGKAGGDGALALSGMGRCANGWQRLASQSLSSTSVPAVYTAIYAHGELVLDLPLLPD